MLSAPDAAMNTIANNVKARGAVRGPRERLIQTLWFEALGLAIVSLPFAHFSGLTVGDSLAMLFTLSIVVMVWAAVHNSAFDRIEQRLTGRLAVKSRLFVHPFDKQFWLFAAPLLQCLNGRLMLQIALRD
jgi:uncharacterized membrane protein